MIGKELRNGFRLGHRLRADVFEEPDHDAAKVAARAVRFT
jgi:hypothetical protein